MSQKTVRRTTSAAGVCVIGLMLAACQGTAQTTTSQGTAGSGSGSSTSTSPAPSAASASASSTTPSAPGATASGSSGSSSAGAALASHIQACTGDQIRLTTGGGGAGMSHTGMVLIFTNTGSQSCSLTGYAGAALTFANGNRLNATRTMNSYLGGDTVDTTPQTVVLAPGGTASDVLDWVTLTPAGSTCQGLGSTSLLVTTPGTTATQKLANGESSTCSDFTITPVVPGATGSKSS